MTDINNELNQTEQQVNRLKNDVQGLEKELEIIPYAVINSDNTLSNYFDNTSSQIKEFKNQLSNIDKNTDFSSLNEQLSSIKRNVTDIMAESSKIAINAFDTSDSQSLKSELNAIIRSFNEIDNTGTKVKDVITSINPELGAVIDRAIYTTDILETLMGFVTKTDLKKTTGEIDLAKGTNLGLEKDLEQIENARRAVEEQKKYIAETYPNGSKGLSDVKSRIDTNEFIGHESELDAYNRELAVLDEKEKGLIQTTREFEEAQIEVKKLLESNNVDDAMYKFKGYFDMYNLATTTLHKLEQFDDIKDYIADPFYMNENDTTQIKKDFEEILPKPWKIEIDKPETQLNELVKEEDAIKNIADRQAELLNNSKYITAETRNRIDSEERLNTLIAQRQSFDNSQLEMANKIASTKNIDEENKFLDLNTTKDLNTFEAYMTSVEQGIKEIQQIRENILKAQNTINNPNFGAKPFMNTISSTDVESFEKLQQLFNSGLKINAEGIDLNYIKQLGMYLDSTREIAQKFKAELSPEVGARNSIFSELYSVEAEGKKFITENLNVKQQYLERAKTIAQLNVELEKLESNKDKIVPNLDVNKAKEFDRITRILTDRLDKLNKKQEEIKPKLEAFGIDIPNTKNIRTSNNFDYIKNMSHVEDINGKTKTIYDYKELAGEIENIIKLFEQETAAAEKARQAEEADKERQHQQAIKDQEKAYENLRNKVNQVTSSIKHAIASIIGVIRTANNILHKIGITIISVFNGAIRTVQRIIQLFGNLGNRIGLANKHTNILRGSFTELKSAIDLLSGAFNKIFNNQFIEQGRKLLSSIQSLKMIMGTDLTNSTIEWANKMEDAFGLSAEELISNLREVAAVMYGLGMSTKDVQVGARNLETVGMVLSSISGLGFDEVMTKIQSGMKGMTQSIDDLGLSVRESQMDAYLKKLKSQGGEFANISTSFSSLNEQQRVYVRYAALMDQFTSKEAYTMEKYAESLRSTTGSLSVLNSQLNGLKSAIGTLAMGLFSKVLQPLIYVVYYIKQLIIQLGSFLGIKMKLDAEMNGGGGEINTTPIENETDALDEMTDAANKAKGALDELDHISTMSSSSGKSGNTGNSDFDYSSLMNNYDFADALAEYDANFIEECRQSFHNMLSDIGNDIEKFIKKYSGRIIDWDEVKKNLSVVKESLGGVFTNLVSIAKTAFGTIAGLAYSVFDDLEFTSLTAKFSEALLSFTTFIDTAFKRIQPYVQLFYDRYLSEHVKKFGKYLSDTLDNIKAKFDGLTEEWNNMDDSTLVKKTDELGEKFNNMLTTLKEIGIIFKTLAGLDTDADNQFMNENASDNMKKAQGIAKTTNSILKETLDIIYQVLHGLADLNDDGVVDSKDLGVAFDFIKEKLDMISTWLKENKDEIVKLLENAAETAFKLAETKFDLIMGLLQWITDNESLVNGFLNTLKAILDIVKEHPVLTIGVVGGARLFGGLGGLANAAGGLGGLAKATGGVKGLAKAGAYAFAAKAGYDIGNEIAEGLYGEEYRLDNNIDTIVDFYTDPDNTPAGQLNKKMRQAYGEARSRLVNTKYAFQDINYDINSLYNDEILAPQMDKALQTMAAFQEQMKLLGKEANVLADDKAFQAWYEELSMVFGDLDPQVKQAVESLHNNYNKLSDYDKKLIESTYGIKEYTDIQDELLTKSTTFTDKLTSNFKLITETIKTACEDSKSGIGSLISNLKEKISNTDLGKAISEKFNLGSFSLDTDGLSKQADIIKSKFEGIGNTKINNIFNADTDTLSKQADIIKAKFENMGTTIKSSCDTAKSGISGLIDKLKELLNSTDFGKTANSIINLGSSLMTGKKTKEVKKLLGFANGGLPSSGSLFMANEDGNTELVGNFGGYAGVANQGMIISAMESAVYNAVTQALKTNTGNGGNTTIEVCKGGVFVGDEAGIRKLANQLNNVNSTGRTNIANVGFSMT